MSTKLWNIDIYSISMLCKFPCLKPTSELIYSCLDPRNRLKLPGGHPNIKMPSYQYRDPHVKDETVSPTVLSLTWESPYLRKTVFILRRGPEIWNPLPSGWISKILVMTIVNLILNPRQKSRCPALCAVVSLFYTLWYKYVSAWLNWSKWKYELKHKVDSLLNRLLSLNAICTVMESFPRQGCYADCVTFRQQKNRLILSWIWPW